MNYRILVIPMMVLLFANELFANQMFAKQSSAQCTLESITNKLSKTKLNASFVQNKKIPALTKELKSEGHIWLSNEAELVWQVKKPIKSTMVIKQAKIIQFNRKDYRLESTNMTAPSGLAKLFYSIANGDFAELSEQFKLDLQCNEATWQVTLHPKEQQLSQFIKQLSLIGAEQINSFSYIENRGDKTQVLLTHLQESLSAELSRYLE